MPFTFRLDPATEARIRRLAASGGRSRASVIREAVAHYAAHEAAAPERSPLDVIRPFLGVVRSGGANLSSGTHARFRARLARKQRERRPR